jgi:hypothetical protein
MNPELALLKFANLLEVAHLVASGGNVYERQEELIKHCREKNSPFVATMPMRHQFRCASCGVVQDESIYHFENPGVETSEDSSRIMWGPAKAIFSQLEAQALHNAFAHGEELPISLSEVLLSVGG